MFIGFKTYKEERSFTKAYHNYLNQSYIALFSNFPSPSVLLIVKGLVLLTSAFLSLLTSLWRVRNCPLVPGLRESRLFLHFCTAT